MTDSAQPSPHKLQNIDSESPVSSLHDDVLQGLFSDRKTLPSKYFYDERGMRIFDQICRLDEYYLTRIENQMLQEKAADIVTTVWPENIIELGSGSSDKVCFFLDACGRQNIRCKYWPLDVCSEALAVMADTLAEEYPWLHINTLVGDYSLGLDAINLPKNERNLALFMGSTIGNLTHSQAVSFLHRVRMLVGSEGRLLVGMDRVKDTKTLIAAYNDSAGLTAQFNMNILEVINCRMGANFAVDKFEHRALYNRSQNQIEMHLVSKEEQIVYFEDLDKHLALKRDESIRTEISRKFSDNEIESLLTESGFTFEEHYVSDNDYFSLVLAKSVNGGR